MMEKKRIRYRFHVSYHISHNENYICCVGRSVNLYDIHTVKEHMSISSVQRVYAYLCAVLQALKD